MTGVSLASNAVAGILAGGGDLHGTIADVIISSNFGGITMQGSGGIWTITSVSVTSSLLDAIQLSSAGQVTFTPTGTPRPVSAAEALSLNRTTLRPRL